MKSHIKIFVPFALAILIGSLTFAFAQSSGNDFSNPKTDGGKERHMPPNGLHPRILEELNLTDAQKEQIAAIQTSCRNASKENFDKIRTADEQLRNLVEGENFNEEQARTILTTKAQAMTELEIVRLRADVAILKVLTAEQKTQIEQLKQQRSKFGRGAKPGMPPQN